VTVLDNRLHLVCGVLLTSADARPTQGGFRSTHRDEPDSPRSFLLRQINFNPSNPRVYVRRCARSGGEWVAPLFSSGSQPLAGVNFH
jgi:hypothetical protein